MSNYQLLPVGIDGVLRTADGANIPADDTNRDWQDYQAWLGEGNTPDPAPTPPNPGPDPSSPEFQFALRTTWVQQWMDETAQENYYVDEMRCLSYLNSDNATYKADAVAMSAWRDALWPALNAMPANWPSDPMQWPLWDSIQPLLPQPADFGWVLHDPVAAPPQFVKWMRSERI